MKMTFQPKKRSHSKVHGFRARMSTPGGRKVLPARRKRTWIYEKNEDEIWKKRFKSKTCKRKKEIIRIGHSNVTFFSLNFHGWRIACSFRNH